MSGCRLGLVLYFDTNFAGDSSDAACELRALDRDGWIDLARTDTVDTELGGATDETRRAALLAETNGYVESMGPMVWDHSRRGHAVWANDDDSERLDRVHSILFPNTDRHARTGWAKRKLRDAMHVATAIRYGANAFITRDEQDLVSKSDEIAAAFDGFQIMPPEMAQAFVRRRKNRCGDTEADPLRWSP